MTEERLNSIKNNLQGFDLIYGNVNGTPDITIRKEDILNVCEKLYNECGMNWMVDAVSIDRYKKQDRYEMVYNLRSTEHRDRLFIRIKLGSKEPEMETLTVIWPSANWYEREAYDMMGIKFLNHPDPRRMYMPEDYEYYPLRKDFPLMGIPGSIPLPNK
jgi:NADH-quinone oxidoreductase subunit C